MNEFRKKYENRLKVYAFMCLILPFTFFIMRFRFDGGSDFSQGLVTGVFSGAMLAAIFFLARTFAILHDEEKLKKQYVEETDERNIAISKETMRTASMISLFVTGIAVIITGFINEIISITLCTDMIVGIVITCVVQTYYKKKM